MRKIVLLFVMTLLPIAAIAYDFEYNGVYYNSIGQYKTTQTNSGTIYYHNVEVTNKEGRTGGSFQQTISGEVIIPETFTVNYGPSVTYHCTVTKIGDLAFANAYSATLISIPSTVTSMGFLPFTTSSKLKTLIVYAETPPTYDTQYILFPGELKSNITLYVPYGSKTHYKNASGWGELTIEEMGPSINGHEYVDLGLPSGRVWAKANYGANMEENYGVYLNWSNLNIISSEWGGDWSAPTIEDYRELLNNCSISMTYNSNNVYGCTFTGPNGNTLFLPAAGFSLMNYSQMAGNALYYWSRTPSSESPFAYSLSSNGNDLTTYATYNYDITSMPVRPVANKPNESYPDYKDESQVFVDLGLPSGNLWAKVNVGGTYVYDFGNKYAYGETSPKDSYYNIYYKWYNVDASEFIKYLIDGPKADFKTKLDSEDDVATVLYGENYHLPSQNDYIELVQYCSSNWEVINGTSGRMFTGPNGNSIFLPAAGFTYSYNQYLNELGYYLTTDVYSNEKCWLLYFSDSTISTGWTNIKNQGYAARAVYNNTSSGINTTNNSRSEVEAIYDVNGIKSLSLGKGINIVKTKDGKTKKVLVK